MNDKRDDVAATLERLYPPVIGGPGWEEVLERLEAEGGSHAAAQVAPAEGRRRRTIRQPLVAPLAAALAILVVVAAPALAFSPRVRELVGLQTQSARGPVFIARVTGVSRHGPNRPGTLVTVTFTVGEQGKPPGTGVPQGSTFLVLVTRTSQLAPAYGKLGHYRATTRLGPGGLTGIQIGGYMPSKGPKVLNGGFWIPTVTDIPE